MAEPKEPKKTGKKKAKKARSEPVYVPVAYPLWFGAASFAWAVVGWLVAAFAPRLAFVPLAGVLHLVFPTVTVALLGVNLYLAVRNLLRGAHALRLALITGVEVALFTTLFFQFYAHLGAELYDAPGATTPWQWLQFSAAHAFRAGDVFDAVEAYGWGIQPVKHVSPLVGVFVIAYHVVVDVFFLGLVWAALGRFREAVLADDEFRGMLVRLALAAFAVWFIAWVAVAFVFRPWRFADIPLWFVENFLRVVDFADVMESFGIRLHTLPREGVVGTLTLFCRLWIGVGLAVLLTRKRKPPARRVLTPPGVAARPYWGLRAGALAGMTAALFVTGLVGWLAAGRPAEALAAAVKEGPDGRAEDALRALRRMGPSAGAAVPALVEARAGVSPAVRDGITRTLGYLGASAAAPLREIALTDPPESASLAVDSLAAVGGPAAPDLVAVWEGAAEPVKDRADAALRRVGGAAVGPLTDGFTQTNAHGHYVWLEKLDPNWRLRNTTNPTAVACQGLPKLVERATNPGNAEDAAKAMGEMLACGTAAKVVLPTAIGHLGHQDHALQSAAAGLVIAAGPAETPELLRTAKDAKGDAIPAGVVTVLKNPRMWTDAVKADPGTLPALLAIAPQSEGFPIALEHLKHYGPAAAPAVPVLIPRVADDDAALRGTVRETLDAIRPDWKADPALDRALPALLYQLPKLPPDEAEDLYAAFRPLTKEQAASVRASVDKRLKEVDKMFTGRGAWTKESPAQYAKSLDEVYGPVERLGPRAKALAPGFVNAIKNNTKEYNDPKPRIVTARLLKTLPAIGGSEEVGFSLTLDALGYDQAGFDYVRREGKAAVPHLGEMIDKGDTEKKLFAMRAAAALRGDAAELAPRLLAALPKGNVTVQPRFNEDVWLLERLTQTLTAVDPDWWGRPEAVKGFAGLLEAPEIETPAATKDRQRVLDLFAAGPKAAERAPKVAAELLGRGQLGRTTRLTFDKLNPKWRDDPDVKTRIPGLVDRLFGETRNFQVELLITEFGGAAVPAITERLDSIPDIALIAPPNVRGVGQLRDSAVAMLVKIGPPAKGATPALLKMVAKPQMDPMAAAEIIDALDKTDPGWEKAAAYKDAVGAAGQAFLKRAAEAPQLLPLAGRCGVEVVPELTRRLTAAPSPAHKAEVLNMINVVGRPAKGIAPAVGKLVSDKEHMVVRKAAIAALGRVGAGDPSWATTLFPGVSDPEAEVRSKTGLALDQVDPDWRAKPAAKQAATAAIKQLTDPSPRKRYDAVGVLDVTRWAPAVGSLEQLVARETDGNTKLYAEGLLARLRKKE